MAKYRVLSLDGGGIRGLLTAQILVVLEKAVPDWIDKVDLVAGTSTGGILALGLASGLEPTALRDLYYDNCGYIFDDSWLDDLFDLGTISGAEYDNRHLRSLMRKTVGTITLGELKKKVLISAFDLDNENPDPKKRSWKPKFFHNFEGEDNDGDAVAYKVALYTSAAPTFFPSVDGFVDGGVMANNPSMAALAQVLDERAEIPNRPALNEIVLLSIGTGKPLNYIKGQRNNWGYARWAKPILNVMMDGGMGLASYQCRQLLGDHFLRISPVLTTSIDIAACDKVDQLVRLGRETDLQEAVEWLRGQWI